MHRTFFLLLAVAGLVGCAPTNDSGVLLQRKPDLSGVMPGTPISRLKALGPPLKREALTGGNPRGAEVWIYEWDLPDDGVNNRMFTSVVVQDGVVLSYSEETADKWRQDPSLLRTARVDSALEDVASLNATAARYQRIASVRGNYNLAPYAEAWDRIAERAHFIRGSGAGPGRDVGQEASAQVHPEAAPDASPIPPAAPPLSQTAEATAAASLAPAKTLRELEIEELRIRKDPALNRKERLRQLHEIWRQQREVMGEEES